MSTETIDQSTKYIQDVASKAHSNIKTFIQPENLKAFASKTSENVQAYQKVTKNVKQKNKKYPKSKNSARVAASTPICRR